MIRAIILAAAVAMAAPAALAHGTASEKSHHGGQVVVAKGEHDHHLELVVKDGEITLYVRDEDDKPDTVKGATASATVLAGGKQETIRLLPQEGNVLKGKSTFAAAKGMKVVVSLTLPDHKPVTARFTPAD